LLELSIYGTVGAEQTRQDIRSGERRSKRGYAPTHAADDVAPLTSVTVSVGHRVHSAVPVVLAKVL
jgi:hypothetical protein